MDEKVVYLFCPMCKYPLKYAGDVSLELNPECELPIYECEICNMIYEYPDDVLELIKDCPICRGKLIVKCCYEDECGECVDCPEFCLSTTLTCSKCGRRWRVTENATLEEVKDENVDFEDVEFLDEF